MTVHRLQCSFSFLSVNVTLSILLSSVYCVSGEAFSKGFIVRPMIEIIVSVALVIRFAAEKVGK